MANYQKPFVSDLKRHWAQRFPLWRRGICKPVFWADRNATFTNDSAIAQTGLAFHAGIHFSPKWTGAFTCDVVITSNLEPISDDPPLRFQDDIATLPVGSYRIGWFVAGRDIWWRLVDDVAELHRLYDQSSGIDIAALGIERTPDHWYAASYDVDLPQIILEASVHFSNTFEQHVIPKLHRNA